MHCSNSWPFCVRRNSWDIVSLPPHPLSPGHPPLFTSLDGNLAPQSNQFQVDTVISNLEAGGTFALFVDGHQLASEIAFNTDAATTASDLVTAVNADATLSSIVTATDNGDGSFSLTSVSPKIVFRTEILHWKDGDVVEGASVSTTRIPSEIVASRLDVFEMGTNGRGFVSPTGQHL